MVNIGIFGSCCTRDAFEIGTAGTESWNLPLYLSRTTVVSSLEKPADETAYECDFDKSFDYRRFEHDMRKTHFQQIEAKQDAIDYLILDFIDERHRIYDFAGTRVAGSIAFQGYLKETMPDVSAHYIPETSPLKTGETLLKMGGFVKRLGNAFDLSRVILHKAYWCENYIDANGDIHSFDTMKQYKYKENNHILDVVYDAFQMYAPQAKIIEIDREHLVADGNHKWGLTPYHYTNDYYERFMATLSELTQAAGANQ